MSMITRRIDDLLQRRRSNRSVAELEAEVEELRARNDRLREAMRRCVTCEYRIAVNSTRLNDEDPAAGEPGATDGKGAELAEAPAVPTSEGAEPGDRPCR